LASGCELEVIVHATLSEKEIDTMSADMQSFPTDRDKSLQDRNHGPFMKHVMGYQHQLVLTIFSGRGFLLGIFAANALSYKKKWRPEAASMLQLFLGVLFAAILVAVSMSKCFLRRSSEWTNEENKLGGMMNTVHSSTEYPKEKARELQAVLGYRPNVPEILQNVKEYCQTNNLHSVGVSVCGPDRLVSCVIGTSRAASSSSVGFVVDEETFDW